MNRINADNGVELAREWLQRQKDIPGISLRAVYDEIGISEDWGSRFANNTAGAGNGWEQIQKVLDARAKWPNGIKPKRR